MLPITVIRFSGILLMFFALAVVRSNVEYVFFTFTFAHYILALIYSSAQIAFVRRTRETWIPCALVLVSGLASAYFRYPHTVYHFGLHFVLTEMFLLPVRRDKLPFARQLLACRLFGNTFLYFQLIGHDPILNPLPAWFLVSGYLIATACFFAILQKAGSQIERKVKLDFLGAELIAMATIAYSLFRPVGSMYIIFYHVLSWVIIPIPTLKKKGWNAIGMYFGLTVVINTAFWVLTPRGGGVFGVPYPVLRDQLVFWAYIHAHLSFMLSALNPDFVLRWFSPRGRLAKA